MPANNLLFSQPQVGNNAQLLFGESETPTDAGDALVTGFSASGVGARGAASVGTADVLGFVSAGFGNHQQIVIGVGAATAAATVSGAAVHTPEITAFGLALSTVEAAGAATHTPNIIGAGAAQLGVTAAGVAATAPSIQGTGAVVVTAASSGAGAHAPPVTGVGAVTVASSSSGTALTAPPVLGTGAAVVPASLVSGSGVHIAPVVAQGSALVTIAASGNGQYFDVIAGVGAVTVAVTANGAGAYIEPIVGVGNALLNFVAAGAGQHVPSITGIGSAVVAGTTAAGLGVTNISSGVGVATVPFTANGTAYFGSFQIATLFEVAAISSAVFTFRRLDLFETLEADDYTVTNSYYVERESAVLTDARYPSLRRTSGLAEAAVVTDSVVAALRVSQISAEAAVVTDAAVLPNVDVVVDEAALISSAPIPRGVRAALVDEQAVVTGRAYSAGSVVVEDAAVASDTLFALAQAVQSDAALVFAEAFFFGAVTKDVAEAAQLDDATFATSIISDLLSDNLYVFGEALPPLQGIAWAANLGNWAMSRYTDYEFTSVVDGFAASAAGVYVQGTGTVPAKFESGRARMSSTKKARLEYVYTDVATPAPMDIIVTGDTSSGTMTHTYTQLARDLADTKAAKTKVGKGFHSSYYSVAHSSTAPFLVQKAELLFGESTRRI